MSIDSGGVGRSAFVIPELGQVTPDSVYDVGQNRGWVIVGIGHGTGPPSPRRASGDGGKPVSPYWHQQVEQVSFIRRNLRRKPVVSREVIVNLISATNIQRDLKLVTYWILEHPVEQLDLKSTSKNDGKRQPDSSA